MKHIHVFLVIFFAIAGVFSCRQQADNKPQVDSDSKKAARLANANISEPTHDFQKINISTSFGLEGEVPNDSPEISQSRILPRRDFVAKSGIPILDPFTPLTTTNSDWKKADEKYRQFLIAQQGHEYLPIFRRAASTVILKDFALLADESEEGKQAIAFYTNELFESGRHTSAALVYYCLKALEGTWSDAKIKEYAQRAIAINNQNPELAQMRDAPARVEREKATATAEEIKQVEPMIAKLEQIVAEQDKYIEKLRAI